LFADDTSVTITDKNHYSFKQKKNLALTNLIQWSLYNKLVINVTKTNVIKFIPKNTVCEHLDIHYKDKVIDEAMGNKFLCMHIVGYPW